MSRFKRGFSHVDPGIFVVLAICLLALWPFISRPSLPLETDAELHIFRLAELSRLIRAGELFPRWAPNFYYGYGYPIFNYYAPLTYYLGLGIDFMPVLGPVQAVKALFILGLAGAGIGMYSYVRELWGRPAGLVSAAAYIYAPYVLFVDPHARGDLAESFSFALFPLALWAMDRLRRRPSSWNWLISITLVSAVVLSHNLMAMVFTTLLAGWVIWQMIIGGIRSPFDHRSNLASWILQFRLLNSLILGVGVAAFFWLALVLEQDAVNLSSLVGKGGHFDFRNHFLTVRELFSLPQRIDWGASEPNFLLSGGLVQLLLGGIGILAVAVGWARRRSQGWYFVFASAGLVLMILPVSTFFWEILPLIQFLQFPWRLLGPLAAVLAVLNGIGTDVVVQRVAPRVKFLVPAIAVGLIMISSLALIQVPPWPEDFGATTAARVLQEELSGRWLGTTSTADFVPARVDIMPKAKGAMKEAILNNQPIDRVNWATLPEDTEVITEYLSPLHFRYHVSGNNDFLLRLFLFDFPGWRGTVDGQAVKTEVGRPEGFLVVPVPAGEHEVEVEFGQTPARTLAVGISGISLFLALLIAWFWYRNPPELAENYDETGIGNEKMNHVLWSLICISLAVFLLNAVIIERAGWLHQMSTGAQAIPASFDVDAKFGDQIALIGYDSAERTVHPGDQVEITAYWKALQPLDINYQVFVHLKDAEDNLVAQSDKLNPGDFPTKRWPIDKYVRDEHQLLLPADLPPGEYQLSLGLWVVEDGWRLPLLDNSGAQIRDNFILSPPLIVE